MAMAMAMNTVGWNRPTGATCISAASLVGEDQRCQRPDLDERAQLHVKILGFGGHSGVADEATGVTSCRLVMHFLSHGVSIFRFRVGNSDEAVRRKQCLR